MTDHDNEIVNAIVQYSETGHAGAGWYVWDAEYPDEGAEFFDHEPTELELQERGYRKEPT
jgi:hypothetical protein